MEESGVKWVIERFYGGRRNVWRAKPSYPQTLKPSNLHMGHALYTQYHGLSNLFILNTTTKMSKKYNKKL
jgi:hypothetical protein